MGGIIVGGERVSVGSVLHLLAAELVAPSRVILGVVLLDPLLAVKVARKSLARTQLHRRMKASALFSVFASYSHKYSHWVGSILDPVGLVAIIRNRLSSSWRHCRFPAFS